MTDESARRGEGEPRLRVILARHGETTLNVEQRFRGRADVPLTPRGQEQAALLGRALVRAKPRLLLASPRQRALETARAIGASSGLDVIVEPRLEDIDYGEWTGLTHTEVAKRWPGDYDIYRRATDRSAFPSGESMLDLETRVANLLSELSKRNEHGTVVLVTHDIVIRALVCRLLDAPLAAMHRLCVDVASTTGVSLADDRTTVDWINNVSHLQDATVGAS
jgi:broad specificity phosphatase PhoE